MKRVLLSVFLLSLFAAFLLPHGVLAGPQTAPSYSLSFPKEPMSLFYPTFPNQVQQVEAFLWKDGDYSSLKTMTGLTANWKIAEFVYVVNTNSYYFEQCPQVRKDLPCIMFSAHVTTQNPGRSFVSVEIYKDGEQLVWNSAGLEVVNVTTPTPALSDTPQPTAIVTSAPTATPTMAPNTKLEDVEQKVLYLEEKVSEQNKQIQAQQSLLNKIIAFLSRIFGF